MSIFDNPDFWPNFDLKPMPDEQPRRKERKWQRNQLIAADRAAGATVRELSQKYGLGKQGIYHALNRHSDVEPPPLDPPPAHNRKSVRNEKICEEYTAGSNSIALAKKYDITRERVCQILRKKNIIEHRKERRDAAKEALAEETSAIRDAAKKMFQGELSAAVEIVRGGSSYLDAMRQIGWKPNSSCQAALISACKSAGIKSLHGRWRDFGPTEARARELRAQGKTWDAVCNTLSAEGHGSISTQWIHSHLPDLIRGRKTVVKADGIPVAPKPPKPPEIDIWTDDRVKSLIENWMRGLTAQHCADLLGAPFTRSSVIGKINRLRADGRLKQS